MSKLRLRLEWFLNPDHVPLLVGTTGLRRTVFALTDWGLPDFCQLILIATPEVLRQRRSDLQAFLKVLRRRMCSNNIDVIIEVYQ
jgi:hypothetical protein